MSDIVRQVDPGEYGAAAVSGHNVDDLYLKRFARAVVSSRTGEEFFDALVRLLWAEIGADLVFIGEVNTNGDGVETRVVFQQGARGQDFSYLLEGTPCATVIGPLQACIYADGVAEKFSEDTALVEMGARGYAGIPLFDRDDQRIGVLVAVTHRPIEQPDAVLVALKLFARRAGLELEHERAVREAAKELAHIEERMIGADEELALTLKAVGRSA